MAEPPQSDAARPVTSGRFDEERLAHALISRGLLTAEEVQPLKGGEGGAEGLLNRLVSAELLTRNQARRAQGEMTMLLGQQIPGYQMLEKLGHGAMGVVYKARQVSMNRLVAIKVLQPKLAANADFLERLKREAHIAARLSHNNIVQAIDVGSAGPLHYFVMELVEGKTIRQELDAGKLYTEHEAVEIVCQVAQALSHAHRRGLIHRDVKPANIVMTEDGVAKLADLGLARSTTDEAMARSEQGLTIGTPHYIAPEQIEAAGDIDGRADLYSLGATLFHMVTGRTVFPHKKVADVLEAHLHEELTPPDHLNAALSTGLGEVVERMLAKDRRQRYRNADDVIIDLECLLAGEAPKLARQGIESSTLHQLAEGEADGEAEENLPRIKRPKRARRDEEEEHEDRGLTPTWAWVAILGGLFGLSALLNLILLTRRH